MRTARLLAVVSCTTCALAQGSSGDELYAQARVAATPDAAMELLQQAAERTAINAPMQGTAADIIKRAMVDVENWLLKEHANEARMTMQVHDELVLEAPEPDAPTIAKQVAALMSSAAQLDVPLKVDAGIGKNWDEAH